MCRTSPQPTRDGDLIPSPVTPREGGRTVASGAKIAALAADIKLGHTIFALPFALLSTFVAAGGHPGVGKALLILACMVTARTFAMAMNRLLDAKLDGANPRTAGRAIPAGRLSRAFVAVAAAGCAAAFILSCGGFWLLSRNAWPIALAVPVLLYVSVYPFMKRFTRFCHYYLGGALALAPICAWLAVAATLAAPPLWMAAAVLCWTAGFDVLYACQDYAVDVAAGIFSVPAKVGIGNALWIARGTHGAAVGMLIMLARSVPAFGPLFYTAIGIAAVLLIVEHAIVRADDLSKLNVAFFTINGVISGLLGMAGIVNLYV